MESKNDRVDRLELVSAMVLSIAALGASWATYQSGLWDGEQAASYSRANELRTEASQVALEGDALATVEVQLFHGWLEAKFRKDEALADFYQARFPPGFKPAFNAWLADRPLVNPSAPSSPFATSAYHRPGLARAQELAESAEKTFAAGQHANTVSDAFQQGATILALALFFGGIGQVFKSHTPRVVLLTVAGIAMVAGFLRLVSLPLQVLGVHPLGG